MSMGRRRSGAWRVATAWETRAAWSALPAGDRALLDSLLRGVAATLGLRQWVSEEEAEETFALKAVGYHVDYRLEPASQTLWVTAVHPLRAGGKPPAN
ncbi:hypothetical protein [Pyxidicoccus trucidator]|uniref:hypothetical protein n=1 Tax=Pyxidicoccus trucidator TaxID=2709662 RepID=UPI0013DBE757|nr:hypothetical protein [Pyxidicoccus trucidator]